MPPHLGPGQAPQVRHDARYPAATRLEQFGTEFLDPARNPEFIDGLTADGLVDKSCCRVIHLKGVLYRDQEQSISGQRGLPLYINDLINF